VTDGQTDGRGATLNSALLGGSHSKLNGSKMVTSSMTFVANSVVFETVDIALNMLLLGVGV